MTTNEQLRTALARRYGSKPVTILGTIVAVDETAKTCDIDDDGLVMYGIRLQCVTNAPAGILCIPKEGAAAIAVKIEDTDSYMLLNCAEYSKIIFNGGNNGGLINIQSLVDKINAIEKQVEALKKIFKAWQPVYEQSLQTAIKGSNDLAPKLETQTKDLEDTTVTH